MTMRLRICQLVLIFALCAPAAFGQGCTLCSSNVSAASQAKQAAFRKAIVVMLVPGLGLMVGLITLARKYRPAAR